MFGLIEFIRPNQQICHKLIRSPGSRDGLTTNSVRILFQDKSSKAQSPLLVDGDLLPRQLSTRWSLAACPRVESFRAAEFSHCAMFRC